MGVLHSSHRSRLASSPDQLVTEWSPDLLILKFVLLFYTHLTDHAHHRSPTKWWPSGHRDEYIWFLLILFYNHFTDHAHQRPPRKWWPSELGIPEVTARNQSTKTHSRLQVIGGTYAQGQACRWVSEYSLLLIPAQIRTCCCTFTHIVIQDFTASSFSLKLMLIS